MPEADDRIHSRSGGVGSGGRGGGREKWGKKRGKMQSGEAVAPPGRRVWAPAPCLQRGPGSAVLRPPQHPPMGARHPPGHDPPGGWGGPGVAAWGWVGPPPPAPYRQRRAGCWEGRGRRDNRLLSSYLWRPEFGWGLALQTPKPPRSLFAPGGAEVWVLGGHRSVPPTPHGCGAAGCPSGTLGLCWLRGSRRCPRPQSFASWSAKRHLNYFVGSRRSRRPPPCRKALSCGQPLGGAQPQELPPQTPQGGRDRAAGCPPPRNRSSCSPGMNGESRGGGSWRPPNILVPFASPQPLPLLWDPCFSCPVPKLARPRRDGGGARAGCLRLGQGTRAAPQSFPIPPAAPERRALHRARPLGAQAPSPTHPRPQRGRGCRAGDAFGSPAWCWHLPRGDELAGAMVPKLQVEA